MGLVVRDQDPALKGSKRYGSVLERIERDVITEPNSGCWLFVGAWDARGYGRVRVGRTKHRVHRLLYEITRGDLTADTILLHSCDNPCCCNPDHLFPGTDADNRQDAMAKGRVPRGTQHANAKLTDEAVLTIRASSETQRALAARFGVSKTVVARIKRREKWRHL